MLGGESSSIGMVFYDSGRKGDNAVFCRFENGKPLIEKGEKNALLEKMKSLDEKNPGKDHFWRDAGLQTLAFAIIIAAVWIFAGGFFPVSGAFLFLIIGWFPCFVLVYGLEKNYPDKAFEAFRRFHGAEHMMVSYGAKEPETFDLETAKTFSPINGECGTVYAASAFILSAVLGIVFGLIPEIGFFSFLGIIFGAAFLLFLNILNPFNPLTLFQRKVTAKPDETTLSLALEGIKVLFSEENQIN